MDALKAHLSSGRGATLALVLFPGYELLDAWGPAEMVVCANIEKKRQIKIVTVGQERCPAELGPAVVTDFRPETAPAAPEIILIPGGAGWVDASKDAALMKWLQAASKTAKLVLSVCTGAGILGAAGLLDGKPATTNKRSFKVIEAQFPNVQWQRKARWTVCEDSVTRAIVTSSGVSAGADAMLYALERMYSKSLADKAAHIAEYSAISDADNDPFTDLIDAAPNADINMVAPSPVPERPLRVLLVVYDQFELLDTFGPLEMLCAANRLARASGQGPKEGLYTVTTVADRPVVDCVGDVKFAMDVPSLQEGLHKDFDFVLLPGGIGTVRELYNPKFIVWLRELCTHVPRTMTVCSGSALLARTGLLDGLPATTNKLAMSVMERFGPKVEWRRRARFVKTGRFLTSSGVSAGTHLMLSVIEDDFGAAIANGAARRVEFVREEDGDEDPFADDVAPDTMLEAFKARATKAALAVLFGGAFRLGLGGRISARSLM